MNVCYRSGPEQRAQLAQSVAAAVDVNHLDMVQQPVEDRRRQDLVVGEDCRPVAHVLVRRQQDDAPLIAGRDKLEEEVPRCGPADGSRPRR